VSTSVSTNVKKSSSHPSIYEAMGCQSSKSGAALSSKPNAPVSAATTTLPTHQTSTTPSILSPLIVQLPMLEVHVVKPANDGIVYAVPEPRTDQQALKGDSRAFPQGSVTSPYNCLAALSRQPPEITSGGEGLEAMPRDMSVESKCSMENYDHVCCRLDLRKRSVACDYDCCEQQKEGKQRRKRARGDEPGQTLEVLIQELFRAHDLNGDELLDEGELIRLNQAVAQVHDDSSDSDAVKQKYSCLFRDKLDPEGQPVPYSVFRKYMLDLLDEIDRNEDAQEMLVEQFLAEARLARTVVTGDPLLVDKARPQVSYQSCLHFCHMSEAAT
jgi:hypothetical protein